VDIASITKSNIALRNFFHCFIHPRHWGHKQLKSVRNFQTSLHGKMLIAFSDQTCVVSFSYSLSQVRVSACKVGPCLFSAASPLPAGLPGMYHSSFSPRSRMRSCLTAFLHGLAHRCKEHGERFLNLRIFILGIRAFSPGDNAPVQASFDSALASMRKLCSKTLAIDKRFSAWASAS